MPGKVLGVVRRMTIVFMLMTTALWFALLSVVFAQWFAAGTDQWTLSYVADGDAAAAKILAEAEAARVEQLWAQRLAQAIVAGPAVLALAAMLTRMRRLI